MEKLMGFENHRKKEKASERERDSSATTVSIMM